MQISPRIVVRSKRKPVSVCRISNTAVMCALFTLLVGENRENAAAVLAPCHRVLNLYPSDLLPNFTGLSLDKRTMNEINQDSAVK